MMGPRSSRPVPVSVPVETDAEVTLESVLGLLEESGRTLDEELVRSVYDFSAEMHSDQRRRSGEPYLTHPVYVAWLLAEWGFDQVCVIVGLLHDVIEDTLTTREVIAEKFGEEVASLVDGVTKISQHAYVQRDDAQAETFRKLILASVRDIRVILVKLADRLHNMMTLEHMRPDAQRRIARETLEIYAPIAHRLGMAKVQADLEDLSFFYLRPERYRELDAKIKEKLKGAKGQIQEVSRRLERELAEGGIEASITFRVKRLYSIHQKLRRQGIDVAQLYDYLAFRVITESVKDCYAALGVVHQAWQLVPGRFKDYIAMPKGNFYQSLHTTLLAEGGQPFEVQIRTREMDSIAEDGIAAHWSYKQGEAQLDDDNQKMAWLRQVLDWQKEVDNPRAFLTALKLDLFPDEVYTFTPGGDVLAFPRGAMPLDFAYRIHTELGHHCSGARVNGKLVPLRTELQTGDRVEIITNNNRTPSRDWLGLVKTSRAKSKIRHWLNTEQNKRSGEIGRRLLERAIRKHKVSPKRAFESDRMATYLEREGIANLDDLFSRVGFGKIAPAQVVPRLLSEEQLSTTEQKPSKLRSAVSRMLPFGNAAIAVRGDGDMLAYLAKCCKPLPGEQIIGYITRGRGVSVHSAECPNVKNLLYDPEREIEVSWARTTDEVYSIQLEIETEDEPGMLARLTETMTKLGSNIRQISASTLQPGKGLIDVVVEVRDQKHFERLSHAIQDLPGVFEVTRRMGG